MNYWDTSALLKLYVPETDSAYFTTLVSMAVGPLVTSELARLETYSALLRKERAGELPADAADLIFGYFAGDVSRGRILTLPIGADVVEAGLRLTRLAHATEPPILVRSLDTLHVASAVVSGAQNVVASDGRLRRLAQLAGLPQLP